MPDSLRVTSFLPACAFRTKSSPAVVATEPKDVPFTFDASVLSMDFTFAFTRVSFPLEVITVFLFSFQFCGTFFAGTS